MSPLGTVIVAWAAVYGYVATYFCMLYARRRAGREYLTFGLLVGCISVVSIADVLLLQAETPQRALLGARLDVVALSVALPFFVEFCFAATARTSPLTRVAYAWALLALAFTALGITTTTTPPGALLWTAPGAHPFLGLVRPWMTLYQLAGWFIAAIALRTVAAGAKMDTDIRILFFSLLLSVIAGGHDILLHGGWIASYPLLAHSAILAVFAMSYVLLDRFARTTEALQQRKFELSASYDQLRSTHERLVRREQLAALGELSAVIAHEVRNPLAIIKNAVSGLRRPNLKAADHQTLLDILDEEVVKLNRLMRDLLAYARPIAPQHESIEIVALLELVLSHLEVDPKSERALHFELVIEDAPQRLSADPGLLEQAFLNIASNAAQAMPEGGALRISVERGRIDEHDAVVIHFDDEGEGMTAEVREKALSPFYTTRPTGTGLGLPIVDRAIRNHGGRVELAESPAGGTRLTLLIPLEKVSAFPAPLKLQSDSPPPESLPR